MDGKNNEVFSLYCSCGCNNGVLLRTYGDKETGVMLSLVSDNYYMSQEKGFKSFIKRMQHIWNIIINKECCYFDICIKPEDLKRFKEFVSAMPSQESEGDITE